MTNMILEHRSQPWFRRLYVPSYRVTDAARYCDTHTNTVAAWHYREDALLPGHERRKPLSYLELVEVAFVAFFRRMEISMPRIRKARDYVAQTFTAEYPFAEYSFMTEGMHVLLDYNQFDPNPAFDSLIVADRHGQMGWSKLLGDKFAEFDYEYELALRWHPAR